MDEILNSVLFLLIGLERMSRRVMVLRGKLLEAQHFTFILVIGHAFANFALAAAAIPIVLVARVVSVALPIGAVEPHRACQPKRHSHPDLGRPARRHLSGAGTLIARVRV